MTARYPYYYLADYRWPEPRRPEITIAPTCESAIRPRPTSARASSTRRVPHVTLKSIANNPDIHEGMPRQEIDAAYCQARRYRDAL